MPRPHLRGLLVGDDATSWRRLGLAIDGADRTVVGGVALVFDGDQGERGLLGWDLNGVPGADTLPVADVAARAREGGPAPARHPLGQVALDHVVVTTGDLDRTLDDLGVEPDRRVDGDDRRMAFVVASTCIIEVVGPAEPEDAPARLWGVALTVEDLDQAVGRLGDAVGPMRPAVQPGRRIATVRHEALGASVPVVLMDPRS